MLARKHQTFEAWSRILVRDVVIDNERTHPTMESFNYFFQPLCFTMVNPSSTIPIQQGDGQSFVEMHMN
jgi:hypothetical protein